ncbi:MAG: phosphodiester glycosidase family protein [Firmicutes bacterium]|nr:phosphodiester glycosidase family protein [Bacillota bacterium]MDH7494368.1 phosphodiester glycosidase family protein [Bacillota bacterium]
MERSRFTSNVGGKAGAGSARRALRRVTTVAAAATWAAVVVVLLCGSALSQTMPGGGTPDQAGIIIGTANGPLAIPAVFRGQCLLLPATFVSETLKMPMRYDPASQRLTFSIPGGSPANAIEVVLHQRKWRLSSGEVREFAEAPTTAAGIPFVPADLLAITGEYEVSWDAQSKVVYLRGQDDPKTVMTDVRFSIYPDRVRVVFDFTGETGYEVVQMKNPSRVVVTFESTCVWGAIDRVIGDVAVNQVRVAPPENGKAKAVLDFNYVLPDVKAFWLKDPARFVVDVPKLYDTKASLTVTRGVRYTVVNKGTPAGPLTVDVLEVDVKDPTVSVRPTLAGKNGATGLARVSELVAREGAIAGVNGVFHSADGTPLGLMIIDGRMKAPPLMNRTALGITSDGAIVIDNVSLDEQGNLIPDWRTLGVVHAVGGGPRLVKDGKVHVTSGEERFKADVAVGRAPRTAAGVTFDGKLLLVAVTGRQAHHSIGVTLEELANLMIELGAKDALNFDGGGSSTMVVREYVMNTPSDGRERTVADAILVFSSLPKPAPVGPLPSDSVTSP